MHLHQLGWKDFFASQKSIEGDADSGTPARIVSEERSRYTVAMEAVVMEEGEVAAALAGRLRHEGIHPVVGDWVDVVPPQDKLTTIVRCYDRFSTIRRKAAGSVTELQVIAANVDLVLVVAALDRELNLRRIERYLTGVWDSGAQPIVVLNKLDLCANVSAARSAVESVALAVPVHTVSARTGEGLRAVVDLFSKGTTGLLVGSSGVGKSSIINCLLGRERQAVRAVRDDDGRGRHTTTRRELLELASGGLLIDTPGMREYALWDGDLGAFGDIDELAERCRFRDCSHRQEPGCAVAAAVAEGSLPAGRLESYRKLEREMRWLATRKDERARREEKERTKKLMKLYKEIVKRKNDRHKL
ncbi:MAG: ribosome small subunit-dependent GTPase A [Planctomycetota bacterium]